MYKQETLLDTIKNIPELLNIQLNNFETIYSAIKEVKAGKLNIIASGTSYNAALAIKVIAWKKFKLNIEVFYPNYFYNNFSDDSFEEDVPYLFISQGGKTKSIIESIKTVKELKGLTISLTENADSPVGKTSDISLEIGSIDEQFMFRTAGYTLSVFTLYLIMVSIACNNGVVTKERLDSIIEELSTLPKQVNETIIIADQWYTDNRELLKDITSIFVAGGSELWPVSIEADIKLMEMVPIMSNSFEIEELIHGPQNSFNDTIGFFMLVNNLNDLEKAESIQEFLRNDIKAFSTIVTLEEIANKSEHVLLKAPTEDLIAIIFITFMQTVSYYLSVERGRDLKVRLNSSIDNYFSKSI